MKTACLLICSICFINAYAQKPFAIHSVETGVYGGLTLNSFTRDTLVAPKRMNKVNVGGAVTAYTVVNLATKNPGLTLSAGLGYSEMTMGMNKFGLESFLLIFFNNKPDSFGLVHVSLKGRYLAVPLGLRYMLSKKDRVVKATVGVQVIPYFNMRKTATVDFDTTYKRPTSAEAANVENTYARTMSSFTLAVQPRLELDVRVYKGFGLLLNYFPFSVYATSYNRRLITRSMVFGGSFGLQYKFR